MMRDRSEISRDGAEYWSRITVRCVALTLFDIAKDTGALGAKL
jgi:hypothetical protein